MNDNAPRYGELRDYLRVLRKRWYLLLVPAVIAAGVAYALSERAHKVYAATAEISVQQLTLQLQLLGNPTSSTSSPGANPLSVAETGNTLATAMAAKAQLNSPVPAPVLRAEVALAVDPTGQFVLVSAHAGTPSHAASLANVYAQQLATQVNAQAARQLTAAVQSLSSRFAAMGAKVNDPVAAAERVQLADEISRVDFLRSNATPSQVARLAEVPGSPSSPRTYRNTALGLAAGLLIGLLIAFVSDALDRRLRGSAEISSELGIPLLGQVRRKTMGKAVHPVVTTDRDTAGDVETFRMLRRNVELLPTEAEHRTVLITSALPEEGKSTVAASLALALTATGKHTLLIEADLRRPSLAGRLGLKAGPGLAEYLAGEAGAADILQTIAMVPNPLEAPAELNGAAHLLRQQPPNPDGGQLQLTCITAGSPTGWSTELLASKMMRALIAEYKAVYDVVVFDTSPLLPVADTLELLPHVDNVLMCVRSGRTTRDQARAATGALAHFPRGASGIVVTDLRASDEPAGYGLYPYNYSYAETLKA